MLTERPVSKNSSNHHSNRSLALRLWLFAAGAFAFGFALVPLYSVLCDITGYGDRSKLSREASIREAPVAGRKVTVEFLASVPDAGDWEFRPLANEIQVRLGRLTEARFFARNLRRLPVVGQAVPSVAPKAATRFFHKTECFCFTQQQFAAGEGRELLVRFMLDPKLPLNTDRITLAYTLYTAETPPGS